MKELQQSNLLNDVKSALAEYMQYPGHTRQDYLDLVLDDFRRVYPAEAIRATVTDLMEHHPDELQQAADARKREKAEEAARLEQLKGQFIVLRAQGKTFDEIADELKVGPLDLIEWSKEKEYDVANLRAILDDYLQRENYVRRRERVGFLGGILKRVEQELSARDLSEIPTDRLIRLAESLAKALKEDERVTTLFKRENQYSSYWDSWNA